MGDYEMWQDVNTGPPMGLWDPGRATSASVLNMVGGSEGSHFPGDDYDGPKTSRDFFNLPVGLPGEPSSGKAVEA